MNFFPIRIIDYFYTFINKINMLSSQQIQYILTLSELQNFSRAAEACFVTQPTLSMQIRKAEEMIGFPIFDRNRSPLELTAPGQKLIPLLREISADFQQLDRLKKQVEGNYLEEIRIGIIPTVSAYLIPALYTQWRTEFPLVKLIIEERKSEEVMEGMLSKKLDLGIMAGPVSEQTLRTIPLFTEEIKAFVPELKTEQVSAEKLKSLQPWLLNKGNCLRTQMVNFCELQEDKDLSHWNYEGGNLEMLIRMVRLNGGYTLIPDFYREILTDASEDFKKITSEKKQVPARSIIGLVQHKNAKWDSIESLIRSIQLHFKGSREKDLLILDWK